jgi:hypothetical protein
MNTLTGLLPSSSVPGCQIVNVPGQKFWHTHICPSCGSSWYHIAPTPMTQAVNEKIHTCTKCGTLVYAFVDVQAGPALHPGLVFAGGMLAAAVIGALVDRR